MGAAPSTTLPDPPLTARPGPDLTPPDQRSPAPATFPASPPLFTTPPPNLATHPAPQKRSFPIREAKLAQDGHTRVEQHVYETLWERAKPHDDISRLMTIGFAAMARLVRLSESNARINLRSLIQKLAIEEHSTYNCEQSLGRTYRIFNYGEILRRRREAGLTWYMRKTLAVVFVDPKTGEPLVSKPKPQKKAPGLNLMGMPGANLGGEAGLNLMPEPPPNLHGLYREQYLVNLSRELDASAPVLYEHLSQYGHPDDDAIRRLFLACKRNSPDCTVDEIAYFVHQKAGLAARMPLHNAIGFLITAVPKCFAGEAFQAFRTEQRRKLEQLETQRRREEAELAQWRAEQEAQLQDPTVPEEEKAYLRKILGRQQ